jgi:hypothetical protein
MASKMDERDSVRTRISICARYCVLLESDGLIPVHDQGKDFVHLDSMHYILYVWLVCFDSHGTVRWKGYRPPALGSS